LHYLELTLGVLFWTPNAVVQPALRASIGPGEQWIS